MRTQVLICGRVQGVFFRAQAKRKADQLGLKGWVMNKDDGRVEALFEGPKDKVEAMVQWCWQGSTGSKVSSVKTIKPVKSKERLDRFEIRY